MDKYSIPLSLIAAVDRKLLIGVDGERMPWHLPDDLRHFRRLTTGKPVIMGRRTFESIGRPLPKRLNIVLTRGSSIASIEGVLQTAADFPAARRIAEEWIAAANPQPAQELPDASDAEVMVIGGADVYAQALPCSDRLYLTEIDAEFVGNNHFPPFARMQPGWAEVSREAHQAGDGLAYAFVQYDRKADQGDI